MSANSKIEWTERTWNPIRGCSKVSEGCRNCYAMRQAHRFSGEGGPYRGLTKITAHGPEWTGKVEPAPFKVLEQPFRWKKPLRVFVNSMSDLGHEDIEEMWMNMIFAVMAACPEHQFQILTKRMERLKQYLNKPDLDFAWSMGAHRITRLRQNLPLEYWHSITIPLPNVWLGTSIELDGFVGERGYPLLDTPAAVRFLSCEPLLGPLNLRRLFVDRHENGIHWVIVGGESGPGARPMNIDWVRDIINQCRATNVPVFVKQLGAKPYERDGWTMAIKLKDRKGGNPEEWPEELRVREYPKGNP